MLNRVSSFVINFTLPIPASSLCEDGIQGKICLEFFFCLLYLVDEGRAELVYCTDLRLLDGMRIDLQKRIRTRPATEMLDIDDGDACLQHVCRPSMTDRMQVQIFRKAMPGDDVLEVPREIHRVDAAPVCICEDQIFRIPIL